MNALSPTTRPALRTSPSTRPSTWMSPVEVRVPFTTRSALMMDGAALRPVRLRGCNGVDAAAAADAAAVSFLLENMSACLDKSARIADDVIVPDLIVNMRSGTPPRRSEPADRCAFGDLRPYLHENR